MNCLSFSDFSQELFMGRRHGQSTLTRYCMDLPVFDLNQEEFTVIQNHVDTAEQIFNAIEDNLLSAEVEQPGNVLKVEHSKGLLRNRILI